jgi:hypothetical protein
LLSFVVLLGFDSEKCGASPLSTAAAVDGGFNTPRLELDAFYNYLIVQIFVCCKSSFAFFVDAVYSARGPGDPAGIAFDLVF